MGSWIFLVAFLFHIGAVASLDPQYILIVPAVVQSNPANEACVHLQNLNETAVVKVTLEYKTDSYSLLQASADKSHFSQCISFKAPTPSSDSLAFIVLSVQGSSINFYERRSVAIRNVSTAVFVQSDKPTYKPGQKVLFRVVSLDTDFKPVIRTYSAITIQDPQGNVLAQWLNRTSSSGILQLEFQTVQDARLGSYQITVDNAPAYNTYHWFQMEEYVLPRYKVETNAPERISPFDEEFNVDICARYTYGQPVHGTVQIKVCRLRYFNPRCDGNSAGICETIHAQLGKDGCVSKTIHTKAFRLYANIAEHRYFFSSLHAEGVVTETGTGIQISNSKFISVYQAKKSLTFEKIDQYYKRGLFATGQVRLRDEDNSPLANGLIFLEFNGEIISNYTTDKNGIAQFSISTSNLFEPQYKLRAFYEPDQCTEYGWLETYKPEAVHYLQRFFSRTDSFLKIEPVQEELPCGVKRPITVHYILNNNQYDVPTKNVPTKVYFYYIVMVKGKIIANGKQQVNIHAGQYDSFSFPLNVDYNLAPRGRLLVYFLHPHDELIADSIYFEVEKCFRNKVSLQFSEKQALPASDISLLIEAASNSLCALQAVDRSVLLLNPGNNLSPANVFNRLPYLDLFGYHHNGLDLEDYAEEPCIEWKNTFFKGLYYVPVNVTDDGNVYDILQNLGLKVFSSISLRKPVVCQNDLECKKISSVDIDDPRMKYERGFSVGSAGGPGVVETVRTFFPETWIWDLVSVDSSGKTDLPYKVPDTITEWVANAFCVDDSAGFGLSQPALLTAFQPFFIDLALPYSTIRGEGFVLKSNVFNYQNHCIEVTVTLKPSADFRAENLSPGSNGKKICANETASYAWRVNPLKLGAVNFTVTAEAKASEQHVGRRDTVIKPLLVEPEGIKKEVTQSSLLCTKGTPFSESVTLNLPSDLVPDSATASFSVLGDILGTALRNAESLLQMPYGCGEQSLAMFLANLRILKYLNDTDQLTEEKKSRIIGHLTSGYQRQLLYRRDDGSFSTFGSRNAKGNLWLTAQVYKAFALSKPFIYIDENVLNKALIWIASKQKPNGGFETDGDIYNNAVKDRADDGVLTAAYVIINLLEAQHDIASPVIRNGLSFVDAASSRDTENIYENALLAYMYGLAGKEEKQKGLLEVLKATATETDGFVFWERKKRPQAETFASFHPRAASAEIEITSYILLSLLRQPNLSQQDLTSAFQTVRWIVKNQNPLGGFSSTQDTPVALQALSQYGILTFTKAAENTVAISSTQYFKKQFHVNSQNSVLLQQTTLPNIPASYTVEVSGTGCVYTQTTLKYNIIQPALTSGFFLALQTSNASCTENLPSRFDVIITARYTGKRNVSNMVIIDIKLLSGFVPDSSSLKQLQNHVMRTETRNDHVFIYLEYLSAREVILSLTLEEAYPVSDNKPALVKTYDYYETDEFGQAEYNTPCLKDFQIKQEDQKQSPYA